MQLNVTFDVSNRPFYSCVLSGLAFVWKRGWSWLCFDINFMFFICKCKLFGIRTT